MTCKVLVIGSGGREHALCLKLRESPLLSELFCVPGNPGIAEIAHCRDIKVDDIDALLRFARQESIDLTVVGPEYPLTLGVADRFQQAGLKIFGPYEGAARLESSKYFAKEIMCAAGVPTAAYRVFNDRNKLLDALRKSSFPTVLKADGLASGKGVVVAATMREAEEAVTFLFDDLKSHCIVLEEFLVGIEASFIVATNGEDVIPFLPAHDYKRIFDGDRGSNTGGMGSVCPTPRIAPEQCAWAVEHIMRPVLQELARRNHPFCGFLYAGLMLTPGDEIKVLEFNVRFGDPECQSILNQMESDLLELLLELTEVASRGRVRPPRFRRGSTVCVVLAADGYPLCPITGDEILGLEMASQIEGVHILQAATTINQQGALVTNGGRVLNVVAYGDSILEARSRAYRAADMIQIRGAQVRRDIAST